MLRFCMVLMLVVGCGESSHDETTTPKDCEVGTSPEIGLLTVQAGKAYPSEIGGASLDVNGEVTGSGISCIGIDTVFAYLEGAEAPKSCKEGTIKKATYRSDTLSDLKYSTLYSVRACAYRNDDNYMSPGVTGQATTKAEPDI